MLIVYYFRFNLNYFGNKKMQHFYGFIVEKVYI